MQHLQILKSLIRIAMANETPQLTHQVDRLIAALKDDGDVRAATAITRTVTEAKRSTELVPSRISRSLAPSKRHLESLTAAVAIPVDKETATPLARIVFPDEVEDDLPIFTDDMKDNIDSLLLEWTNQEALSEAGLRPALTCLVYGPPGTGKTTLALWLARRMGVPAVVARLDGLISSFLGTTARNLGYLFAFANRYECILILDEFDAIAKVRDDPNEVGEIKRVVNALLQNMDARERAGVTIGITNHELLLDPAIWRRFEVQLAVPLPNFEQRLDIALRALGRSEAPPLAEAKLIAWVCEGASGSEVVTMANKYRKRRVLQGDSRLTPLKIVGQLAQSTSVHIQPAISELLLLDEVSVTHELRRAEGAGFTQTELGFLLQRDKKTIGRRARSLEGAAQDGE
jgi:SpoVK/Ycf46/Vps4 family AAA+-type ATPase